MTETLVTQWKRTYLNLNSFLPLLSSVKLKKKKKKRKFSPKVASCVVLLIVPAPKAQSLAHGCRNKIMAAGGLQSRRQKPPEKQRSGQEGAVWLGGGRRIYPHIGTFLNEDLIQLVSQVASISIPCMKKLKSC